MRLRNDSTSFGLVAQLFHWSIVALIVTQYVLGDKAENLPLGAAKLATLAQHKSIGMTILGLALLRLIWRWINPVPTLPADTPGWQRIAARLSHFTLYALILLLPVLGWTMSSARNFPVSWFGIFTFPDLVSPDTATFEFLRSAHHWAADALFWIALLHIAAAFKHHFIDRDNVLRAMLPVKQRADVSP